MIKKSRFRFVLVTMLIVLVIFSVFAFGYYKISKSTKYDMFENILNNENQAILSHKNDDVFLVSADAVYINGKLTINKNSSLTEEKCRSFFENSKKQRFDTMNNEGNYYYKLFDNQGFNIFIIKDMTKNIINFKTRNIKCYVAICGLYFCIFVIVYLLSFKVFEPVEKMLSNQKSFISDASHELKTPITIISANADVISENDNSQWVQNIKSQATRLDGLVADMLSLAKFDEKKVELINEDFDLTSLAYETLLPFDAVAFENEKKINLNIQPSITVHGDKNNAKKIMTILIDNAIKYSLKYSEIFVNLSKEKNVIKFSVMNSGSSIKDEDANKVFERFYRGANSRNQESGGSGLGLSIAKSIADNNGWKLFASSHYGESMEITLYIKSK